MVSKRPIQKSLYIYIQVLFDEISDLIIFSINFIMSLSVSTNRPINHFCIPEFVHEMDEKKKKKKQLLFITRHATQLCCQSGDTIEQIIYKIEMIFTILRCDLKKMSKYKIYMKKLFF